MKEVFCGYIYKKERFDMIDLGKILWEDILSDEQHTLILNYISLNYKPTDIFHYLNIEQSEFLLYEKEWDDFENECDSNSATDGDWENQKKVIEKVFKQYNVNWQYLWKEYNVAFEQNRNLYNKWYLQQCFIEMLINKYAD